LPYNLQIKPQTILGLKKQQGPANAEP
jgi:hypothetical protein